MSFFQFQISVGKTKKPSFHSPNILWDKGNES